MSIHPDGTGTGWTNVETVDINQPHGKDYLYIKHVAKGVRKRTNQEHSAFADATVGGIHKPGGCAVLGMEITDAAGDPTGAVIYDGTYRARGLVWSYVVEAGANKGVLFCITDAAGTSTSAVDWTVVKLHPDLQWSGQDVTWAGAHEFDASVDISGNVAMDGDLTVDGKLLVDGTVNFAADVAFAADASFDGTVDFGGGVAFVAEVSIDGVVKIDNTSVAFGGAAGIGLFYDPTTYAGGETNTLANGLIEKMGYKARDGVETDVSYGTAFPTATISVNINGIHATAVADESHLKAAAAANGFTIVQGGAISGFYWRAVGH